MKDQYGPIYLCKQKLIPRAWDLNPGTRAPSHSLRAEKPALTFKSKRKYLQSFDQHLVVNFEKEEKSPVLKLNVSWKQNMKICNNNLWHSF